MENKTGKEKKFFKIPQTKSTVRANLFLAAGLILLFFGIFLTISKFVPGTKVFFFKDVLMLGLGAIFLFFAFAFTRSGLFVFLGLTAVLSGFLSLLIDTGIIPVGYSRLWPLEVIFCGIAMCPAGLYKLHRARTVYLFPAISLIFLGAVFLIFSLNDFSFSEFVGQWWPLFLLFAGAALIGIYIAQRNHPKEFPYMKDDSLDEHNFSDSPFMDGDED